MKRFSIALMVGFFMVSTALITMTSTSLADTFPSKDIRIVVGAKPGGGFDTYSRAIGRFMTKYLPKGINVLTENRPGAGQRIGFTIVYNADPDGHTIGFPTMPGLYLPQLIKQQKYDMTKATWLITILRDPRVLCVAPGSKFKTVKDLQKADSVKFAIVGYSSETGVLLTNQALGIKASYISGHKNSKEAVLSAFRGDADGVGFTYGSMRKHIAQKKLIPVVVMGSEKRLKAIPDVPTLAEAGSPELNAILGTYRVLAGPPNMPPAVTQYLRDVLWKTLNDPEFQAWSKKAKRPVEPVDGETTEKNMRLVMESFEKYKGRLEKYLK